MVTLPHKWGGGRKPRSPPCGKDLESPRILSTRNDVEHGSGRGAFFKRAGKPQYLPCPCPYPYPNLLYPTLPYPALPNTTWRACEGSNAPMVPLVPTAPTPCVRDRHIPSLDQSRPSLDSQEPESLTAAGNTDNAITKRGGNGPTGRVVSRAGPAGYGTSVKSLRPPLHGACPHKTGWSAPHELTGTKSRPVATGIAQTCPRISRS